MGSVVWSWEGGVQRWIVSFKYGCRGFILPQSPPTHLGFIRQSSESSPHPSEDVLWIIRVEPFSSAHSCNMRAFDQTRNGIVGS